MPVVSTRRRFLTSAAGIAAGGAALALAIQPVPAAAAFDPVYDLIAAHRNAHAAHLVALEEQDRLDRIDDPVCTENSNPDVTMVKSAEYRV
jgi:hypothetical protein